MWDFKRFAIRHAHFLTHFIRLATESCERVSLIPHRCPIHCSLDYQQHINLNILFSSSFYAFLSNLLFFRSANLTLKNNQIFIYASLCPKNEKSTSSMGTQNGRFHVGFFHPQHGRENIVDVDTPLTLPFTPWDFPFSRYQKWLMMFIRLWVEREN